MTIEPCYNAFMTLQELFRHKTLFTTQRYLHVRGQNRYQVMEATSL